MEENYILKKVVSKSEEEYVVKLVTFQDNYKKH